MTSLRKVGFAVASWVWLVSGCDSISELGFNPSETLFDAETLKVVDYRNGTMTISWDPVRITGRAEVEYRLYRTEIESIRDEVGGSAAFWRAFTFRNLAATRVNATPFALGYSDDAALVDQLSFGSEPLARTQETSIDFSLGEGETLAGYAFRLEAYVAGTRTAKVSDQSVWLVVPGGEGLEAAEGTGPTPVPVLAGYSFTEKGDLEISWQGGSDRAVEIFVYSPPVQELLLPKYEELGRLRPRTEAQRSAFSGGTYHGGLYTVALSHHPVSLGTFYGAASAGETRFLIERLSLDHSYLIGIRAEGGEYDPFAPVLGLQFLEGALRSFIGIEDARRGDSGMITLSWTHSEYEHVVAYRLYDSKKFDHLVATVTPSVDPGKTVTMSLDSRSASLPRFVGVRAVNALGIEDQNNAVMSLASLSASTADNATNAENLLSESDLLISGPESFGDVVVQDERLVKSFSVLNNRDAAIIGRISVSNSAEFAITDVDCAGSVVAKDESCSFQVAFTPGVKGVRSSLIQVSYRLGINDEVKTALHQVAGVGVSGLHFAGIGSYRDVGSKQVTAVWVPDAGAVAYKILATNSSGVTTTTYVSGSGSSEGTISGLSPETAYSIGVVAVDGNGVETDIKRTLAIVTTPDLVLTSSLAGYTYPNPAVVGQTVAFEIDNTADVGDGETTYTCSFDTIADGSVTAGAPCSSLPATALDVLSFASQGNLSWTISSAAAGTDYELKITASRGTAPNIGTAEFLIPVQVAPSYDRTNLIAEILFKRANEFKTPFSNLNWSNAVRNLAGDAHTDGTLVLEGFSSGTGYSGTGVDASSPAVLSFNAAAFDSASLGGFSTQENLIVAAWVRPHDITASGTLMGNGSGSVADGGFEIEMVSRDATPYIVYRVGSQARFGDHAATALSQPTPPQVLWTLDDAPGQTPVNSGTGGGSGISGTVSLAGGSPPLAATPTGFSMYSPGIADYGFVADESALITLGALGSTTENNQTSWEFWFQTQSVMGNQTIFTIGRGGGGGQLLYAVISHGMLVCSQFGNRAADYAISAPVIPGETYHLVVTWDHPQLSCYLNGNLLGTMRGWTSASADTYFGTGLQIAGNAWGGDRIHLTWIPAGRALPEAILTQKGNFFGYVDNIAMYGQHTLTASEVKNLYRPHRGATCAALSPAMNDEWVHITASYVDSVGKLFINGVLACTFESPSEVSAMLGGLDKLWLGARGGSSNYWDGDVGMVTAWSDHSDVAALALDHYQKTRAMFVEPASFATHASMEGLRLWYDAEDRNGNRVADDGNTPDFTTGWNDRTNLGNHFTAASVVGTPTYSEVTAGHHGVRMDGSTYFCTPDLRLVPISSAQTTFAAVMTVNAYEGAYGSLYSLGYRFTGSSYALSLLQKTQYRHALKNIDNDQTQLSFKNHSLTLPAAQAKDLLTNGPTLLLVRVGESLYDFYLRDKDGNEYGTTGIATASAQQWLQPFLTLGGVHTLDATRTCTASTATDVTYHEIKGWNRALSDAERTEAINYFIERWQN